MKEFKFISEATEEETTDIELMIQTEEDIDFEVWRNIKFCHSRKEESIQNIAFWNWIESYPEETFYVINLIRTEEEDRIW